MTELRSGDWVEVRSKEEILRTLDRNAKLDAMPFMPQMFEYCGKRFQVQKRAHKTCDTVNPVQGRGVTNAVHLETRCNGRAYGGCQAQCLIFWKDAWLKPVAGPDGGAAMSREPKSVVPTGSTDCSEEDVLRATQVQGAEGPYGPRYACQATQLPLYTQPLRWWDARQYVEDYTSGNASLARIARGFLYLFVWHILLAKRGRSGRPARAIYDWIQSIRGSVPYPRRRGTLGPGQQAPRSDLNLQPGEWVRLKSFEEIRATLSPETNMNRGLFFDAEMVPFCGGTYRVKARVSTFIDEKTGYMTSLKTPALILEDVWCQSRYSNCRMFCPRGIYSWWREVWLERVDENRPIDEATNLLERGGLQPSQQE